MLVFHFFSGHWLSLNSEHAVAALYLPFQMLLGVWGPRRGLDRPYMEALFEQTVAAQRDYKGHVSFEQSFSNFQ